MVKWRNAGGQTKRANEQSFVYRPPAWRRWRNVKTTYYVLTNQAWFVAQVRNWRRSPLPSRRWKVLPTLLICCLKIVIRWRCALQTIRRLAFLFSTNLKHALSSWNLPQAVFIEKKINHYFFGSYPTCFVIGARLKFARWIIELH